MGWLSQEHHDDASDAAALAKLGYKQELVRHLNTFRNFAVCFSFLSPITGLTGTFSYTWLYGGPVAIVWGWILVTAANVLVGATLSELASAFPTAGGVFYWSGRMGGQRYGPVAAWIVGFFCLLGEIASTAGVVYTAALLVQQYIYLGTGGPDGGYLCDKYVLFAFYVAIEILIGLVNTFSMRLLDTIGEVSVWFHVVGVTAFVVILPALAPTHMPASWVFGSFAPVFEYSGLNNAGWSFLLALLGSQWAMVGYDAAAHMSEETKGAAIAGPISLMATIFSGFLVGFSFVLAVLFSVQSIDSVSAAANGPVQVVWDVFVARFGSGVGALGLLIVPLLCSLFCANACLTACSRVMWAFSRDGDLRVSKLLRTVHPTFRVPVNAVWASVLCQIILGLPQLYSYTAFAAITSIGVIGLYISYLVPMLLRVTVYRKRFEKGPFNLGPLSVPVAWAAIAWCLFAVALFIMPQVYPVTGANLNYAPVAVGIVLVLSVGWWVTNAHKWFKGPRFGYGESEADVESSRGGVPTPSSSAADFGKAGVVDGGAKDVDIMGDQS